MIFQQWIYDSHKSLIYYHLFDQSLSELQINSISRTLPSLLRTVEKFNNTKDLKLKTFNITGVNIHIYKRQNYTFVLSTISGFQGALFNKFIKFTLHLLLEVKKLKIEIKRDLNNYFSKKNIANRNMMVKEILEIMEKNKEPEIKPKVKSPLEVTTTSQNNRFIFVGTASVGKSSIITQFFNGWDLEAIKSISPTIMKNIQNIKEGFTKEDLYVIDLGGQTVYRKSYLKDIKTFLNIRCLIFVLDIQNEQVIQATKDYFKNVLNRLIMSDSFPPISVFFHKFDPERRDKLQSNVQNWMEWFNQPSFHEKYNRFQINFHLTSVFDNSAREALARTLLYSLPTWLINKAIQHTFNNYLSKMVYPLGNDLIQSIEKYGKQKIESEIFNSSVSFGMEVANLVINDWTNYVSQSDRDEQIPILQKKGNNHKAETESIDGKNVIRTKIKCPLPDKLKNHGSICEITHGLFVGVGKSLGFRMVTVIQSEIRDRADKCIIEFEY